MPQVEAAACGVPVAATDYSAMHDVLRFTKGYPIPVKTFFREIETNAERAYPDNDILASTLTNFFSRSPTERMQESISVRKATLERYNWDKTAKVWENYIDTYTPVGLQGQWEVPPVMHNVPESIPENMSNEDFIKWLFNEVLHAPEKLHQQEGTKLYRDFQFGADIGQGVLEPIDKDKIFKAYQARAANKNQIEYARGNKIALSDPFVLEAHQLQGAKQ